MRNKVSLLLLLQLCLMMNSVFAQSATISVAPEVKVDGGVITLSQLAEINGDDAIWVKSLGQIRVGNAPLPGKSIVLTKELLNMRIAAAGSDINGIVWNLPEVVTVTTRGQTVNANVLIDKATEAIKQQMSNSMSSEDFSIMPVGSVQDVITPIGTAVLTGSLPSGIHSNTPTSVIVAVSVNGQVFTKVGLKFDVKWYRQVLVVTDLVNTGEILSNDKLRYERMDIGRLGPGYFTDINKVLGMAVRRPLTPGMVLMDTMFNKPMLVKQGNMVNIVARIGNMQVTATGRALQDGSEGQLIRVQNINSTKIISAKVVDASTVEALTYKN